MPELKRRRREAAEEAAARRRRQREEAAAEAAATEGEAQGAPIDASNIGAQMLQNMGWNSTRGLGKAEDGIRAPITVCASFLSPFFLSFFVLFFSHAVFVADCCE